MVIIICIVILAILLPVIFEDLFSSSANETHGSNMKSIEENLKKLDASIKAQEEAKTRSNSNSGSGSSTSSGDILDPNDPQVIALIDEAVEVINDMLESGHPISSVTDLDYEGLIHYFPSIQPPYSRSKHNICMIISMMGVGRDLRYCDRTPPHPNFAGEYACLEQFLYKYGNCYESGNYKYTTKHSIHFNGSEKKCELLKGQLKHILTSEVKKRCKKAIIYSSNGLRTDDVAY